jgi:hypothetical protein
MFEFGPRCSRSWLWFCGKLSCRLDGESRLERLGAEALYPERRLDLRNTEQRGFRGHTDDPGTTGQYADVPLHAGLVCINGPDGMTAEVQCELFAAVLAEIGTAQQLVNEVIEVYLDLMDGELIIHRYPMPNEVD